ncbi:ankrd46, partial [Symbiodinium pilosum]
MSGQELPISMEEISDVLSLKASLRRRHGYPLCVQQFLHNGICLDNSTELNAPVGLQLVLLTVSSEVQRVEAAQELTGACVQGDLEIARRLLEAGANKNSRDHRGYSACMLAA